MAAATSALRKGARSLHDRCTMPLTAKAERRKRRKASEAAAASVKSTDATEAPEELEAPDAGEGSPAKWASEAAAWAAREAGVEAPPPADDGEDWAPRSSPLGKSLSKAAREAAMEIG